MSSSAPSAITGGHTSPAVATVVVYSSSAEMRARVRASVGTRPAADLGAIDWVEVADGTACLATLDAGGVDAVVLDGEAWPTGGMGVARQVKDEYADPPATILLTARRDDRWLAAWSRADRVVPYPVDPFALTDAVVAALRERAQRELPPPKPRKSFGIRVHGDE